MGSHAPPAFIWVLAIRTPGPHARMASALTTSPQPWVLSSSPTSALLICHNLQLLRLWQFCDALCLQMSCAVMEKPSGTSIRGTWHLVRCVFPVLTPALGCLCVPKSAKHCSLPQYINCTHCKLREGKEKQAGARGDHNKN